MAKDTDLPEKINAIRSAEANASMCGALLLKDMPRFIPSLLDDAGEVAVDLAFGNDEHGICFVKGQVQAIVKLQCQRCMEPFDYKINDKFVSGIVKTEEAAGKLPEKYDPIVSEDGFLNILERVEDELIISLPIVPMHELKNCKVQNPTIVLDANQDDAVKKENPFNVIEILRAKNKTGSK